MIRVCESYAKRYHITFNPVKSKLLCFNVDNSLVPPIYLNKEIVTSVNSDLHLGNYISTNIHERNMTGAVCDFYQRSNSVISDFRVCDSDIIDKLHTSFCMHMYGCELWNLSTGNAEPYKIAWRRVKRRIWNLPNLTHNTIVHSLSSDVNVQLDKRIIKFIYNSLNNNDMCHSLLQVILHCKNSCFADNYRLLSYRYQLCSSDWNKNLSYLLGKVKMKVDKLYPCNSIVYALKDLCSMRDNRQHDILSCDEINTLINDICVN